MAEEGTGGGSTGKWLNKSVSKKLDLPPNQRFVESE
jgi:hypothetical protein